MQICVRTEIPTIIDPGATINYPSATGSIIVGITVSVYLYSRILTYASVYVFVYEHAHIVTCISACVCTYQQYAYHDMHQSLCVSVHSCACHHHGAHGLSHSCLSLSAYLYTERTKQASPRLVLRKVNESLQQSSSSNIVQTTVENR